MVVVFFYFKTFRIQLMAVVSSSNSNVSLVYRQDNEYNDFEKYLSIIYTPSTYSNIFSKIISRFLFLIRTLHNFEFQIL